MSRIVLSTSIPKRVIIMYILHRNTGSEKQNCFCTLICQKRLEVDAFLIKAVHITILLMSHS